MNKEVVLGALIGYFVVAGTFFRVGYITFGSNLLWSSIAIIVAIILGAVADKN